MNTNFCKSCGNSFNGRFCNICGEKIYSEKDKSIGHILHEGLHFFTHFDNKFFKTIKVIFARPGLLSITYCNGIRSKYYKPFSLFFIGVVLYLLFPFLPGLNMSFEANMINVQAQGFTFISQLVDHKLSSHNITIEELASRYNAKSPAFAKILLLIIPPLTAIALKLLFFRRKKYFFDHLILGIEASCITLYLVFFVMPFIFYVSKILFGMSDAAGSFISGDSVTISASALYLIIWSIVSFKRFYEIKFMHALLKGVLFLLLHFFIIYVLYKLILFLTILIFI